MENQTGLDNPDKLELFYHIFGRFVRFQREDGPCRRFAQELKPLDSAVDLYCVPPQFLTQKTDIQCLAFQQQAPLLLYVPLRSS